ncbi:MAG TPA: hypothetical protein VH369_16165 [Bryobacteraceae bacterium]|jgi:hypothetical protein
MTQLGEAISRYHKLVEQEGFGDSAWAEQLQERMRQLHLTESGRVVAPILRPHFISRRQLDTLSRVTGHLAEILDRVEEIALASPQLLNRLQMLPAEKMLAAIPAGYSRFSVTSSMDAAVRNGTLCLQGLDACKPVGFAYSGLLADLFLELPIVKEFKRGRYKLSKIGGSKHLATAIHEVWREFERKTKAGAGRNGHGGSKPTIAVLQIGQENGAGSTSQGLLLAESLNEQGGTARLVSPEQLEYSNGRLRAGDYEIDVVYRLLLTRELLARFDLSHPLLRAYGDGAVCVVNSFRSEFAQRRSLFELLTDEAVTTHLPTADRKLIRTFVPWTRIVGARKTFHEEKEIDLPAFILEQREHLALLPSDDTGDQRIFKGSEMTQTAWERALRVALRSPYVVQERRSVSREVFPVYQYGEFKMKEAEVSVHPHIFNGRMHGASAILNTNSDGSAAHLAIAPVLLLEEN